MGNQIALDCSVIEVLCRRQKLAVALLTTCLFYFSNFSPLSRDLHCIVCVRMCSMIACLTQMLDIGRGYYVTRCITQGGKTRVFKHIKINCYFAIKSNTVKFRV